MLSGNSACLGKGWRGTPQWRRWSLYRALCGSTLLVSDVCPFLCPTDPHGASCDVPQMGVAKESAIAHEIQS